MHKKNLGYDKIDITPDLGYIFVSNNKIGGISPYE